nr:MAG TPA: hypothetical protein [Caudoviricetes sp.]
MCFDITKTVYSILHALRAIVCVAHERANTVRRYIISVTESHIYSLFSS